MSLKLTLGTSTKYSQLKKVPGAIRKLTGSSIEAFDLIIKNAIPIFIKCEKKRLFKKHRKRAFGGGRKPDLELEDRLLLIFMYNNLYLTHEFLGALFQKHNSNISRIIDKIEPLLAELEVSLPERKIRLSESTLSQNEILKIFHDLKAAPGNTLEAVDRSIPNSLIEQKSSVANGNLGTLVNERIITKVKKVIKN